MPLSSKPGATLLRISDALSLRYEKTGEGPPLVLMHTIRTQLEYFRSLAPALARSYTVYAIDLPGHGHSPIDPLAPLDEPYFRQGVMAFIEKLDLVDVTLVGESIGGALALTVAAAVPQRVRRVFAINPYDYETRFGDGIRRGNAFANFIIGSLQIPILGAINASLENKWVLGPEDLAHKIKFGRGALFPGLTPRLLAAGASLLRDLRKGCQKSGFRKGNTALQRFVRIGYVAVALGEDRQPSGIPRIQVRELDGEAQSPTDLLTCEVR